MSEENKSEYSDEVKQLFESLNKTIAHHASTVNELDDMLRKAGEWIKNIVEEYDISSDEVREISAIMQDYLKLTRTWKVTVQAEFEVWLELPYTQEAEDIDADEFTVELSSYYYDLIDQGQNYVEITDCEVK